MVKLRSAWEMAWREGRHPTAKEIRRHDLARRRGGPPLPLWEGDHEAIRQYAIDSLLEVAGVE